MSVSPSRALFAATTLTLALLVQAVAVAAPGQTGCHPRNGCQDTDESETPSEEPLTISAPTDGSEVAGDLLVHGLVDPRFTRVTVSIHGMSAAAELQDGAWAVGMDLRSLPPGQYELAAEARGPRGSRARSTVSVHVGSDEDETSDMPDAPKETDAEDEPSTPGEDLLFADAFSGSDRLVTNEYAYWNPDLQDSVHSPNWQMPSGSLFVAEGTGWSGLPDDVAPDATSSTSTNSAVFRLISQREDFGDVNVGFDLLTHGYTGTGTTPAQAWDGVHVFLRYHSQHELYYVSVDRRDDRIVVKKKSPGGTSNGGTYHTLAIATYPTPHEAWQRFEARIITNPAGSVTITLSAGGKVLLATTDDGEHGPPITGPGRIGVRGDNTDFRLRDLVVSAAGH